MANYAEALAALRQKLTGGNSITEGKDKIKLDNLIAKYSKGETAEDWAENGGAVVGLTSLVYVERKEGKAYCLFTFAEDEGKFSTGAGDFLEMYATLLNTLGEGVPAAMNKALTERPLLIEVWKQRTKKGNTYTKVNALKFIELDAPTVDEDTGEVVNAAAPF